MKIAKFIAILLSATISLSRAAEGWKLWRLADGSATIRYESDTWQLKPDEVSLQHLDGFINSLPASDFPSLKFILFRLDLHTDIQRELLAELSSKHADLLKDAKESARMEHDMHHPKVIKLRRVISQCLLATPSIKKIDQVLAEHGYRILNISHEKLALDKKTSPLSFYAGVYLNVGPKAERPGTGQPANRSEPKPNGSDKPQPEAEGRSR